MLLLAHLAKIQGLKGEFLLHQVMDDPERLESVEGLILAPPNLDLEQVQTPVAPARPVNLRHFRWQQDRPCVAFEEFADRTAAEPFKGWALWMPEDQASLEEGESFRHDWIGCDVFVGGAKVGEVVRLDPTPMGYDMIVMRDRRPGRTGLRDIPYIKEWFQCVDLPGRRIEVEPPAGLLDLDRMD
jgi:16S rRNA processing protein RimM